MNRPLAVKWLSLFVFLAVAVVGIIVGLVDAATARGLAPRLFGVGLAALGLLAAAALFGLRYVLFPSTWASLVGSLFWRIDRRRDARVGTTEEQRHGEAPGSSPDAGWAAWPAAIAAILVLGIGVASFIAGDRGYLDLRHSVFAGMATVAGIIMIGTVFGYPPQWPPAWATPKGEPPARSRLEILKDALGILGVVGVAGAATAFWYTNLYLPGTLLPAVNLTADLRPAAAGSTSSVHATFTAANTSPFRVHVVSSYFDLVVEDLGSGFDEALALCAVEAESRGLLESPVLAWPTRLQRDHMAMVNAGPLFPQGSFLEPGEVQSFSFVAPLPKEGGTGARVLRAYFRLEAARGDHVGIERRWEAPGNPPARFETNVADEDAAAPCVKAPGESHGGLVAWPLVEESLFNELTRDPLELRSDWWVRDDGWISSFTDIHSAGGEPLEIGPDRQLASERLLRTWGLVGAQTVQEVLVSTPGE